MPRGRKPADGAKQAAEQARKDQVKADLDSALAGEGWETPDESDLLVERVKVEPFLVFARQLAEVGDAAGTVRRKGWVRRRFASEEAAQTFIRGTRRALASIGYALSIGGPTPSQIQEEGEDGRQHVREMWLVDVKARKFRPRIPATT